jgi:hypothetical protein
MTTTKEDLSTIYSNTSNAFGHCLSKRGLCDNTVCKANCSCYNPADTVLDGMLRDACALRKAL